MTQVPDRLATPEYLRAVLDSTPVAVFVHENTGRIVDANAAACRSLGYSREELREKRIVDIEQEHRLAADSMWLRLEVGDTRTIQGVHQRADGTTFPVEVQVRMFRDGDRDLFCAMAREVEREGTGTADLTASQLLERDAFREIFANANEAIAIIDHDGRYLLQNLAHEKLLGYTDEELVDKTPAIHLGPAAFQDVGTALATTGQYRGRLVSRTKAGVDRRIELSAFAVARGDGEPPIFVGIKRDVEETDRVYREQADRERSELEESLRQAQKMEVIGQLAAGVAHDINNLLTPILAYSDSESAVAELPESTRIALTEIVEAARRGRDLTRRLLAFGRKQVLEVSPLDLGARVQEMVGMLRRIVPEQIVFAVTVDSDVPAVMADATAIEQILMNLTSNASDAMAGRGTLRITVRQLTIGPGDRLARILGSEGNFVQLEVADTGMGMDAATLDRVFEPFFTRKPAGRGTGLGLSIVHGIVRQHDGFITVDSEPGQGSTFRVILPPTTQRPVPAAPAEAFDGERQSARILVVEDEAQVRNLIKNMLTGMGYDVITAADAATAIEAAGQHDGTLDLLLTDVVMPGLNGPELYRRLRRTRPELPVLFMSGYPRDGLAPAGNMPPGTRILAKPFTVRELDARVRAELATRSR